MKHYNKRTDVIVNVYSDHVDGGTEYQVEAIIGDMLVSTSYRVGDDDVERMATQDVAEMMAYERVRAWARIGLEIGKMIDADVGSRSNR